MIAILLALLAVVNTTNNSVSYTCNGVTATYSVNYPYLSSSDLTVTSTTVAGAVTTLTQTTDWSVNASSTSSTATLTLTNPAVKCPNANVLKISRNRAFTQPYGFRAQSFYNQALHETAYDSLEMQIQQVNQTAIAATNPTPTTVNNSSLVLGAPPEITRSLVSVLNDVSSVKNYGAVGNGVTDDTAAISSAYGAAALANGTVYLPRGTYEATSIKLKPKLTYVGDGVEVTTLQQTSANSTLITSDVTNNTYSGLSRMTVRGNGGANQKLLQVQGLYASNFNQVFFSSALNLVELSEIEGQTVFRDCYFTGALTGGYALRLNNVQDVTIENSPIELSDDGVYATRTNAVTRLKFEKIHSEKVGRIFNIDTATNNGSVIFRDVAAFNVGFPLADPTTGYAFRVNNEFATFENIHVSVTNALTPVIVTPNWSIFAKDCPSFTGSDALDCYIPYFQIGFGSAYIANTKRSLLDPTETLATLCTVTGGAAVATGAGFCAFSGSGQYRIRPLTGPAISPTPVANKAIMVRFEYRSTTAGTYTVNIDNMGGQMIGYSGSTVPRSANAIQLPSTAGVFTKVYFYIRYTAEFDTALRFFYINSTNVADTIDVRAFDIFEVNRPPYSLLDW